MKFLIILLLIVILLFNYQLVSIDKGFVKPLDETSNAEQEEIIFSIDEVLYYKAPFEINGYPYIVIFNTTRGNSYITTMDDDMLTGLSVAGFFVSAVKPKNITPIHIAFYLIAIFITLCLPIKKWKNNNKNRESY